MSKDGESDADAPSEEFRRFEELTRVALGTTWRRWPPEAALKQEEEKGSGVKKLDQPK